MASSERVTWPEFRSLHKGMSTNKMSVLWTDYKVGQYKLPEVKSIDEENAESQVVAMEAAVAAVKESPRAPTGDDQDSYLAEYTQLTARLLRFSRSMSEKVKSQINDRLSELASLTAPENYKCDPTDAWKCWTGPTTLIVLVNETQRVAFICTRDWWNTNYQGAFYVTYETVAEAKTIEGIRDQYAREHKLVKRAPLPSIEIKLPKSLREKKLRGD